MDPIRLNFSISDRPMQRFVEAALLGDAMFEERHMSDYRSLAVKEDDVGVVVERLLLKRGPPYATPDSYAEVLRRYRRDETLPADCLVLTRRDLEQVWLEGFVRYGVDWFTHHQWRVGGQLLRECVVEGKLISREFSP